MASVAVALTGCEDGKTFNPFKPREKGNGSAMVSANSGSSRKTERDVEAPDVFHKEDKGLWDGRPSLGGIWVAYPDVSTPERVIIRNEGNGKSIVGALFRRERENPGPVIQVSSDAAKALGMLAGQPAKLNVTALRREEIPEVAPAPPEVAPAPKPAPTKETLDAPETIEEKPLDPIASAAAAIEAADNKPAAGKASPAPKPAAPVAAAPSNLAKPYVQLGTFSTKANAEKTVGDMRKVGLYAFIEEQASNGKTIWRVLVGPATKRSERAAMLKKVKFMGFKDAYFVSK